MRWYADQGEGCAWQASRITAWPQLPDDLARIIIRSPYCGKLGVTWSLGDCTVQQRGIQWQSVKFAIRR